MRTRALLPIPALLAAGRRCAGRSTRDGQGDAWIRLPAGLCARLAGGSPSPRP